MTSGRRLAVSIGVALIVVGGIEMLILPHLNGVGFLMGLFGAVMAGGVALGTWWETRVTSTRRRPG